MSAYSIKQKHMDTSSPIDRELINLFNTYPNPDKAEDSKTK